MSLYLNQVTLAGNLTRDPVLRTLPSGTAVAEFGLAINERYTTKTGELAEQSCFVEIVTWNKSAETVNTYLKKGSPVLIEGRLTYEKWMNENDEKRSRLRVTAFRTHFIGGKRRYNGDKEESENAATVNEAIEGDAENAAPF